MGRTAVLQDIRMMRFEEIYGRYRQRRLSCAEASEFAGRDGADVSALAGPLRGGGSGGAVRWAAEVGSVRGGRRRRKPSGSSGCTGSATRAGRSSTSHERAVERHDLDYGYTWTKSVLYSRGAVTPARKRSAHRKARPRKPMRGMLVHQDGSRHAWLAGRPPHRPDRHAGRCDQRDPVGPFWSRRRARCRPSAAWPR